MDLIVEKTHQSPLSDGFTLQKIARTGSTPTAYPIASQLLLLTRSQRRNILSAGDGDYSQGCVYMGMASDGGFSWMKRESQVEFDKGAKEGFSRLRTNVLGGLLVCGDEFGGVSGQGSATRVPCALWVGFLLVMYLIMKEEKEMENKSHGDGDGTLQYCLMAYLHHGFSREGEEKYN